MKTFVAHHHLATNVASPHQRLTIPLRTLGIAQVDQSSGWLVTDRRAVLINLANGEPLGEEVVSEHSVLQVTVGGDRMAWLLRTLQGLRIEVRQLADASLLWSDEQSTDASINLQPEERIAFNPDGATLLFVHPMWSVFAYDSATGARVSSVTAPQVTYVLPAFWNGQAHAVIASDLPDCASRDIVALPSPGRVACGDGANSVVVVHLETNVVLSRVTVAGFITSLVLFDATTVRILSTRGAKS